MKPYRLVPIGRGDDPKQHATAQYRLEEFRVGDSSANVSTLPVAGLPLRDGEIFMVRRGKRRPAVIVALSGIEVDGALTRGGASWQHRPAILVAPYYGAAASATRAGWNPKFIDRIQRGEYCQYAWDVLPIGDMPEGSILRFDHVFPIGADPANWSDSGHELTAEAMAVTDEWFSWHVTGSLPDGVLHVARSILLAD